MFTMMIFIGAPAAMARRLSVAVVVAANADPDTIVCEVMTPLVTYSMVSSRPRFLKNPVS